MLTRMIDLHTHILAGLDDGARTLDESVEIALTASGDGVSVMAATPHVRDDFNTPGQTMQMLVLELNRLLHEKQIPLRVVGGAEIAIPRLAVLDDEELGRLALAGNPRYLLIEFPYFGWPLALENEIWKLKRRGITAVLAHPERNPEVQLSPARVGPLVEAGALVQLTAASVDGRLGKRNKLTAATLIAAGTAHIVASDAHWPGLRAAGLSSAVSAIGDPGLARWLTQGVPGAILDDRPIPERPNSAPEPRRRWLKSLSR